MKRKLLISTSPIDEPALIGQRNLSDEMGAVINFLGVVRGSEGSQPITGIEYEAFVEMAEHQFKLIFDHVERTWPIAGVHLVHRIGYVPVKQPSLWVEVVGGHREEAFAACRYIIEEMKRKVPIWKKPVKPL